MLRCIQFLYLHYQLHYVCISLHCSCTGVCIRLQQVLASCGSAGVPLKKKIKTFRCGLMVPFSNNNINLVVCIRLCKVVVVLRVLESRCGVVVGFLSIIISPYGCFRFHQVVALTMHNIPGTNRPNTKISNSAFCPSLFSPLF